MEAKCSSASKVVLSSEENPFSATVFCRCRMCFLLTESVVWRTTEQFFTRLHGSITCASVPQAIIQFKSQNSVLLIFVMHALYVLFVKFKYHCDEQKYVVVHSFIIIMGEFDWAVLQALQNRIMVRFGSISASPLVQTVDAIVNLCDVETTSTNMHKSQWLHVIFLGAIPFDVHCKTIRYAFLKYKVS